MPWSLLWGHGGIVGWWRIENVHARWTKSHRERIRIQDRTDVHHVERKKETHNEHRSGYLLLPARCQKPRARCSKLSRSDGSWSTDHTARQLGHEDTFFSTAFRLTVAPHNEVHHRWFIRIYLSPRSIERPITKPAMTGSCIFTAETDYTYFAHIRIGISLYIDIPLDLLHNRHRRTLHSCSHPHLRHWF